MDEFIEISSLFGLKDVIDVLLVATLLFYIYRLMKESGALNLFVGVMTFVMLWVLTRKVLDMQLLGTIMDQFMDVGLIVLVILFQEQIKRFLNELGSRQGWSAVRKLWHRGSDNDRKAWVLQVVYACLSMAKTKTGALIVIGKQMSLEDYENTGDPLDAKITTRLIENIFFKNSPLHDGALIITGNRAKAAGCILPVSHDSHLPRYLGLRHRSALGIAQATDAVAIVVSEETGNISYAHRGEIHLKLSGTELEQALSQIL